MKKCLVFTAVLSLSLLCCTNGGKQKDNPHDSTKYQIIERSHWLIGDWQSKSAKGILIETWHQLNDSTLAGKSYFMSGADTLSLENIRLEQRMDKLFYIPTVKDQNMGQAVHFTMTRMTDSLMIFENPEHDFPQKISYSKVGNDSLMAEVSAMIDSKVKSQTFRMGKINN